MARVCGVTGRIAVEANMGAISAVMRYGSEPQRRLAAESGAGGDKPAICITEPDAGSAATEMTTRADRRGGHYVLNGKKHWITGGGVSRLHLIFARVFDENGRAPGHRRLPGGARRGGRSAAPRDAAPDDAAPGDAAPGDPEGPGHRAARAGDGPARHPGDRDHLPGSGNPRRDGAAPPDRRPVRLLPS